MRIGAKVFQDLLVNLPSLPDVLDQVVVGLYGTILEGTLPGADKRRCASGHNGHCVFGRSGPWQWAMLRDYWEVRSTADYRDSAGVGAVPDPVSAENVVRSSLVNRKGTAQELA